VHERRWYGLAGLEAGGFSLNLQQESRTYDPTPIGGPAALRVDETLWSVEGRYGRDLAPKLHAEARLTYLDTDETDGISSFDGNVTRAAVDLVNDRWARQSWLVGADYSISTTDHAAHASPPAPGQPPRMVPLASDVDRRITGFVAQDRIDLSNALSVTLGARYDSYSDLQSRLTPRASFVWRASDHHILKAQYAEGFRPPTFFELYQPPAPNVVPHYPLEINRTAELNYVYKGTGVVGRATVYRTRIHDLIRPGGVVTPGDALAKGIELEWEQQVSTGLKLDGNVSRVDTHDPRSNAAIGFRNNASATWLGNIGALYEPAHGMLLAARLGHVGDRAYAHGYDTVSFTISRENVLARGLTLRGGVKDAFDQDISYLQVPPVGAPVVLHYPRRSLFVEAAWRR
jgi:outer membrane receptor protein involved in Fe transport